MSDIAKIVALSLPQFAAFVALFLPGFVSLKVDRLIQPGKQSGAAEFIVDALAYSLLNAAFFGWAIWRAAEELRSDAPNYLLVWMLGLLTCIAGPAIWPSLFRWTQRFGAKRRWLLGPHRFAWDDFFSRKEPCWIIVHLKTGKLVGGYFGLESRATVEPEFRAYLFGRVVAAGSRWSFCGAGAGIEGVGIEGRPFPSERL